MSRRSYDIIFTMALFALYTSIALMLATIGTRIYMNASETLAENYDQRTSVLYVVQKLRQNDASGMVRVDHLGDSDALVLTQYYHGSPYETWLYVYDGSLREVLMAPGNPPSPNYGQAIMPMQSMTVDDSRISEGLLSIEFTMEGGKTSSVDIYLKSAQPSGLLPAEPPPAPPAPDQPPLVAPPLPPSDDDPGVAP